MKRSNSSDNLGETMPKQMPTEWSTNYSVKAMHMMKKMGFEGNKGLGKTNQGRLEPVVAFQQDGRKGLGLSHNSITNVEISAWDSSNEVYLIPEKVEWIKNDGYDNYTFDELKLQMKVGEKKMCLEGETLFCSEDILNGVLDAKTVLDNLHEDDFQKAKTKSNPFETIRSSIFLNRAAVKMANIDSLLDYMFTNPFDSFGNPLVRNDELLYFADICAGPGGFSEYILFRKSWESKGFGFTLRGQNDFKLEKFCAGPPECFDPFYGVFDDGDIFKEENQDSFADYIFKHVPNGVHFVMADGGFSVEGQENIQEILSKQLYLCQFLTALKVLRPQGNFVCKVFDLFTPFSVGLIYLMYKCFDQIAIIKPNSSRPANSEKYLVCKNKKEDTNEICMYLNYVNNFINSNEDDDVQEIVHINEIMRDTAFYEYIKRTNEEFGRNQITSLEKITVFCKYPHLKETRQKEFRSKCLELWNLPDTIRQPPDMKSTEKILEEVLGDWWEFRSFLSSKPDDLCNIESLPTKINCVLDWCFVPIGRGETNLNSCSLFLCKSRGHLLRYSENKVWELMENVFEILPKSLFYGEIVYEFVGEGRTLSKISTLHIIDAIMLGGRDLKRCELKTRVSYCQKYAASISKPFKESKNGTIRSKTIYNMEDLNNFFEGMRHYTLKDNSKRLGIQLDNERYFVPGGILFLPTVSSNYIRGISKSTKKEYFYDKTLHVSLYLEQIDKEKLSASFRNSFSRRLLWKWSNPLQVEKHKTNSSLLSRYDIECYIEKFLSTYNK